MVGQPATHAGRAGAQSRMSLSALASLAPARQRNRLWALAACLLAFVLADVLAFFIAVQLALHYAVQRGVMTLADAFQPSQLMRMNIFLLLLMAWLLWFHGIKLSHRRRRPFWTDLQKLLLGILALVVADLALLAIAGVDLAHTWWAAAWLLLLPLVPLARLLARKLLTAAHLWQKPTIIIGTGDNARQAYRAFLSEPTMGVEVVGFACPGTAEPVSPLPGMPCVRWPGQTASAAELRPFHYVIALEAGQWPERDAVIRQLTHCGVDDLQVIPAMRGVPLYGQETTNFFSHEVLLIDVSNSLARPLSRLTKRIFDIVGASALIVLTMPIMIYVAWRIWREDGSPFIFSQRRVGKGGVEFNFYKFRSMVNGAEALLMEWKASNSPEWQRYRAANFKLADDPRVLKVGSLIRRTSLDELPQLFNVLLGNMSLVGPRPLLARELPDYGLDISLYQLATPGLTGLWQISGRSGTQFTDRVSFDVWYVKNWSLWIDIVILLKTVTVVFKRDGAY